MLQRVVVRSPLKISEDPKSTEYCGKIYLNQGQHPRSELYDVEPLASSFHPSRSTAREPYSIHFLAIQFFQASVQMPLPGRGKSRISTHVVALVAYYDFTYTSLASHTPQPSESFCMLRLRQQQG